ncbi:hypothetical protein [Acinetobacter sp. BSP-28]|uniref:hypothetical protein n=1 Tax=Acinetobacter sp. BSP-28 TaxID=3344661 RepID=UPI00376FC8F8
MTTSTKKFSEYLGADEQGNNRMRLGHLTYVMKGQKIYIERVDGLELVTLEMHVARPWIRSNFEKEMAFQRRKQLAIDLQRTNIPLHERRAYKKRMGWVGA